MDRMIKSLILLSCFVVAPLTVVGCAGGPQEQSTGEFVDSARITTEVKSKLLRDPDVSGLDIKVDTFKATVQLSGFVENEAQKQKAGEIAQSVDGVQEVRNNIEIKPQ